MLTGILLTGVQLLTPIFSRLFMDHILSRHNPQWLIPLLAAMALTLAFQFVVNVIQGIHWLKIEGKLAVEANASFMWHVLRLPVSFFAQRYIGDIASRQASNEQIAATLIGQLAPIFLNLVLLLAYLAIMIQYSPVLAVVGVTTSILYLVSMRLVSKRRLDLSRVTLRDGGRLMGATMSGFEIIETIKASGAEGSFFQRWAGYFASYSNALVQFNQANQFYSLIPPLLQQGSNIIILVMGVYLILDGSFTIGMLLAFQGFTASFLSPVQQLVGASQSFIEMRSQMERVEDVFNYQPDVEEEDPSLTLPLERLRGGNCGASPLATTKRHRPSSRISPSRSNQGAASPWWAPPEAVGPPLVSSSRGSTSPGRVRSFSTASPGSRFPARFLPPPSRWWIRT